MARAIPIREAATACFVETVVSNPKAMRLARDGRWYEAAGVTGFLCRPEVDRMAVAAGRANAKVLFNPINSRAVVTGTNQAGAAIMQFHSVVGVAGDRSALESKKWVDAAQGLRDEVFEAGAEGVDAAVRVGGAALDRARLLTGKFAGDLSERLLRPRGPQDAERDGSRDAE